MKKLTIYFEAEIPARQTVDLQPVRGVLDDGRELSLAEMTGVLFRGLTFTATEESTFNSMRIRMVTVGGKKQRPDGGGMLALFFSPNALGRGVLWSAGPVDKIVLTVENAATTPGVFKANVEGDCIL